MAGGPVHSLRACGRTLELGARPLLMGILNASPESFYDGGRHAGLDAQVAHGEQLLRDGVDVIDVGGQSGVTNRPEIAERDEIERVAPIVEHLAGLGAVVSVDTYRAAVAAAAIDAGAVIVNDPSGLRERELAAVCARTGAALVITHTRALPKQKLSDPRYADVTEDVKRFLRARLELAERLGLDRSQLLVCPGPDLGKEPSQTIELLRRLDQLVELGAPILLSVSRKDFVGALLGRPPRERLAGTLAALAHGVAHGAGMLRVHDVAEVRDFLVVIEALEGSADVSRRLRLADELRRESAGGNGSPPARRAKA